MQAGESCLAAMQRVMLLEVPAHVGPVEERCYQLQRLLGPDEKQRWIAAANTTGPQLTSPMMRFAPWRPPLLWRPSLPLAISL